MTAKGGAGDDLRRSGQIGLSKYATFAGRASRAEFWRWVVVFVLLTLITRMIDGALFASSIHESFYGDDARRPLTSIIILALLLPNIALAVRRLHDIGRSGWRLLMVIPLVEGLVLLIGMFSRARTDPTNLAEQSLQQIREEAGT